MQLNKSRRIAVLLVLISIFFPASLLSAQATETIQIDANASTTPFPHFWEKMFGSGRAILTLRESYRNDLRAVKAVTDFRVRALPRDSARRAWRL